MPETWAEPLQMTLLGLDAETEYAPMFIGKAFKSRLLSPRAAGFILLALGASEDYDFQQQVDLGGGESEQLLQLCFQLSELSYELACTKFDEPQIAIFFLYTLCRLCKRFPSGKVSLLSISNLNETAGARVTLCAFSANLNFEYVAGSNLSDTLLMDMRTLVGRRHIQETDILLQAIPALEKILGGIADTIPKAFEVVHLLAEFFLLTKSYWDVIRIPQTYKSVWILRSKSKENKKLAKPIQVCIARALEATGELTRALEMRRSCGVPGSSELGSCVAGKQLYASIKAEFPWKGVEKMTSREVENGQSALFFRQTQGNGPAESRLTFGLLDLAAGTFSEQPLPKQTRKRMWQEVRIIPDPPSCPLRVLVGARVPPANAEDATKDFFSSIDRKSVV